MSTKTKTIKTVKAQKTPITPKAPKVPVPHFYNGNVKVGDMHTFNKLAGNIEFNGCMGSCGCHCMGCWNSEDWKKSPCYVAKSYCQYGKTVINSHIVNTVAMREDPWGTIRELDAQLKRKRTNKTVRQHSAGELETAEELKAWMWLAKQHPLRKFYVYTKAFEIVDAVLSETPVEELPDNYFINISIWHEFGIDTYNKWKHLDIIRAYAYDDETFDYEAHGLHVDGHCPAYRKDKKGKVKLFHDLTCDKCQLCFQKKAKVLTCLSH